MVLILGAQLLAYLKGIRSNLIPEYSDNTFKSVHKAFHFELTHNPQYFFQGCAKMSLNNSFIAWNFE